LGYHEVFFIAAQLQAAVDPQAENPASINIWPVFSNPKQVPSEDPMTLE
jgi:hypothetical protein